MAGCSLARIYPVNATRYALVLFPAYLILQAQAFRFLAREIEQLATAVLLCFVIAFEWDMPGTIPPGKSGTTN